MMEGYNRDSAIYFIMLGEKLRLTREAKGLQVSDIAKQLFINKQRVIELEKGDFSNIISPLYLRWYLSSYAKIVGFPEYEISDLINEFMNNYQKTNSDLVAESHKVYETAITRKKNTWFYVLFFLSLFLVAFLYFLNEEHNRQYIKNFINSVNYMYSMTGDNSNE